MEEGLSSAPPTLVLMLMWGARPAKAYTLMSW